jgi:hypothetical protein
MTPLRRTDARTWLQVLLVVVIGWFYFWTSVPEIHPGLISKSDSSYYNLLTRGFLKGQLSLDLVADPFLATLKNPYDGKERGQHGAHDISYYRGRYYIYFGVAPVILVFLPFRLLTGYFIDDSLVVPLFACGGLAMSVLLLRAVRARYFPRAPLLAVAGGILALGLANLVPMLLRRANVWEVPIAGGYFCCMAALYALFQAWHAPRRAMWLALASAALGLAVGSRPTYLLGCPALLLALASLVGEERRAGRARRLVLAALLPIATAGVLLALYNYLRFGDPTDFGWRRMLNVDQVATAQIFNWRFLWYNLRVYLLAPAGWGPYFPYVALARLPAAPAGFMLVEDPYGILPNIPVVLFGLATVGVGRLRQLEGRNRLAIYCAAVLTVAGGTGLMTASFAAATNRYMVDFLPAFIVLAAIGLLVLTARPWYRGGVARLCNGAIIVLLAFSALFNVLVSIRHNELFRAEHAELYSQVAHAGNLPSDVVDLLLRHEYGPVEMKVIFPEDKVGKIEPLVATGRDFLADYLFVHYLGRGLVRFAFEHTSRGSIVGEPVKIEPGAVQTLRVDLGSLYPPADHPYFDAMTPGEARRRQETVRVMLNGQVVLEQRSRFYDASSWQPSIGSFGAHPGDADRFSGKIISWRRLPEASLEEPLSPLFGLVRLALVLPPFSGPHSEPLLSSGETGHGDLVYVRYERAGQVSFGYDHWGKPGIVSAPVAAEPDSTHVVEIDAGTLHPEGRMIRTPQEMSGRHLLIRLDGRTVLDQPVLYWTCDPASVAIGLNAIEASTAEAQFSGRIVKQERVPPPP